jgi:hypothetical protein
VWWQGWVGIEKQAVRGNVPHGGHGYVCEGDAALFLGEEGEPLDGRDQTILFQVAFSFP